MHKTANVLDKLPKTVQACAKSLIHNIYQAETEDDAREDYARFQERYKAKYPNAVTALKKDEATLFTFYHYPVQLWLHIRSSNPIESAFSTIRLRTLKTRGQGTIATTFSIVFKLVERAQLGWRRLQGHQLITKIFDGVLFTNGIDKIVAA